MRLTALHTPKVFVKNSMATTFQQLAGSPTPAEIPVGQAFSLAFGGTLPEFFSEKPPALGCIRAIRYAVLIELAGAGIVCAAWMLLRALKGGL